MCVQVCPAGRGDYGKVGFSVWPAALSTKHSVVGRQRRFNEPARQIKAAGALGKCRFGTVLLFVFWHDSFPQMDGGQRPADRQRCPEVLHR